MSIQAKILKHTLKFLLSKRLMADTSGDSWSNLEKLAHKLKLPPGASQSSVNIAGIPGNWITVQDANDEKVILYLHGGAYHLGSVNTHRTLIARICKAARMRALAINYRLAPEHPFPAALDDATSTYRWLLAEGFHPENIIVAGDSAGGGLSIATLISLRDSGIPLPAGVVCLSPWTDLANTGDSIKNNIKIDYIFSDNLEVSARLYAGDYDLKHPLISPLYADLHSLPPLLIQVGSDELLLDDSTRLAAHAQEAGVVVTLEIWEGMIHVFQGLAMLLPESKQAIKRIGLFMQECIENHQQ